MAKIPLTKLNEAEIELFNRGANIGFFVGAGVATLAYIISILV